MWIWISIYWVLTGLATFWGGVGMYAEPEYMWYDLKWSLLLGGFIYPVKLLAKLVK